MRVLLFFDLPTLSSNDLRNYRKFRKFLLRNGFLMLQESVYCKLALNQTVVDSVINLLRHNTPPSGNVMFFCITEKQFSKIELLVGEKDSDTLDSTDRMVIL